MFGRKKQKKIPNMGVLSGDDILEMRKGNVHMGGNEYGNVFRHSEVRRARIERKQRPKHKDFGSMWGF